MPKLTEREYEDAIDHATALVVATAAFNARYQRDFGDDCEFGETVVDLVVDEDPAAIDLLAEHAGAIDAVRAAAKNGARFITDSMRRGSSFTYDASELGGPAVIIVGGASHGDDPFEQFRDVAVLAALLTTT